MASPAKKWRRCAHELDLDFDARLGAEAVALDNDALAGREIKKLNAARIAAGEADLAWLSARYVRRATRPSAYA
jgi:hypothetical protein